MGLFTPFFLSCASNSVPTHTVSLGLSLTWSFLLWYELVQGAKDDRKQFIFWRAGFIFYRSSDLNQPAVGADKYWSSQMKKRGVKAD